MRLASRSRSSIHAAVASSNSPAALSPVPRRSGASTAQPSARALATAGDASACALPPSSSAIRTPGVCVVPLGRQQEAPRRASRPPRRRASSRWPKPSREHDVVRDDAAHAVGSDVAAESARSLGQRRLATVPQPRSAGAREPTITAVRVDVRAAATRPGSRAGSRTCVCASRLLRARDVVRHGVGRLQQRHGSLGSRRGQAEGLGQRRGGGIAHRSVQAVPAGDLDQLGAAARAERLVDGRGLARRRRAHRRSGTAGRRSRARRSRGRARRSRARAPSRPWPRAAAPGCRDRPSRPSRCRRRRRAPARGAC